MQAARRLWVVNFTGGTVGFGAKGGGLFVRAVRDAPELATTPTCQAPDPPQCTQNDPCSDGTCSLSRASCSQPSDCPLSPGEQCCCAGICL